MKSVRLLAAVLVATSVGPVAGHAQRTSLSVTGSPLVFATPTGSDFAAGSITSGSAFTFTVDALGGSISQRSTTVSIRCATPCPAQGGKSVTTLRWRRADIATWTTLSTLDTDIETRAVNRNGLNDPWTNSLYFQFVLDWTSDPPGAFPHQFNIVMTLTVTVP